MRKEELSVIVVDDLGCGALVSLEKYGLPHEPTVPDSIAAGADIVCFSGDKLIGGPQAGIIVGRKDLIAIIKKHPLTRMLRVCKLTDLALERTLRLFLEPETLTENQPTLRMLSTPAEVLGKKAVKLKKMIDKAKTSFTVSVEEGESAVGGGSLPATSIKTFVLAVRPSHHSPGRLSFLLRQNEPPIITRIKGDAVLFDMRTLLEDEEVIIVNALNHIED